MNNSFLELFDDLHIETVRPNRQPMPESIGRKTKLNQDDRETRVGEHNSHGVEKKRNVNILNNILLLPAEGNLGGKRIGCHACSAKSKATRMKFKCPECNIGLCALPCGEGYCTKLHF
jgi:hypothetical protein